MHQARCNFNGTASSGIRFFSMFSAVELLIFVTDDVIVWWEALILVLTYAFYVVMMKYNDFFERKLGLGQSTTETMTEPRDESVGQDDMFTKQVTPTGPDLIADDADGTVQNVGTSPDAGNEIAVHIKIEDTEGSCKDAQHRREVGNTAAHGGHSRFGIVRRSFHTLESLDPTASVLLSILPTAQNWPWTLFGLSLLLIGICTYVLVDCTARVGQILTVSPMIMGLLPLAVGTSFPDTLCSIQVAAKGEGDMAVANVFGSNVFDVLIGLGIPWILAAIIGKEVRFVNGFDQVRWLVLIHCAVTFVLIFSLAANKWRLNRLTGHLLFFLYACFVVFVIVYIGH